VKGEELYSITGTPPNLFKEIMGDAFAPRNPLALEVDFRFEPPPIDVSPTHWARTWLLDGRAPAIEAPETIRRLRERLAQRRTSDAAAAAKGALK
jgi:oligopeptide transport system ATP-binding protein